MEELLNKLNIKSRGEYSQDGSYVIDIPDSDKWGTFYSRLDNTNLLEAVEEGSLLTEDEASLIYTNDEYIFTLIADFKNNLYKLVIAEA